ncbi:MAG: hypothetical protein JSW26_16390 [Desulfobacterales bacterium]|nr:MAG: hypothetical protein JSW26_16390 [Desulfobacterales bacterium]
MSVFSLFGFIFLLAALGLLGYQAIAAFLELGVSNHFVYKNIRLIDILDERYLARINDSIPSTFLHKIAGVIFTSPLFLWFIVGAVLFFLINAFKRVK